MYDDISRSDEYLRKKIAEVLKAGQAKSPDLDSLVQELSQDVSIYHQELEFQNDELRRIQAEFEQSQARYRELYDNAPVGFVSYYRDLRIHSVNRTFAGFVSGDSLVGRKIFTLLTADSQDEFYHHVQELLHTGETLVCQLRLQGPEGPLPVRMESNLLHDADGPIIRSAVSNMSREFELHEKLKATVAELQTFRDRLSGVMLAGEVGWWQMHLDTGRVDFSENKARMLGYPPEQFTHYTDFTSLVHPDDYEGMMENMRSCIQDKGPYKVDYRIRRSDGDYLWFSDVGMISSRNDKGEPSVISGIVININERIQDKIAAQENARKLQLLFDFTPVGLTIADGDGKIINANKTAARILGLDKEAQQQRTINGKEWKIIRRDGQEMPSDEYASVQALREHRLVENVEKGLVKGNGDITWILVSAVTTDIPGLDLVISYLDTTALVNKELELKQNEEKLRLFLDNIPQPVVITDPEGIILDVNAAVCHFYGYSREEVLGEQPRILNPGKEIYRELGYSEKEYQELFSSMWSSIADASRGSWAGVVINKKKDGSLVWVNLVIKGIYNPLGKPAYYIALPIDISSQKLAEKQSRIDMYHTLAGLSELRDNETGHHMRRVGLYTRHLAKILEQTEKYCEDIEASAPMHDIGKVGIPDSILLAPRKLSFEEFEEMKRHTLLGHAILMGKDELAMAAEITLAHHEWYDGTGYPSGLKGSAIPLSARITAIADVYDALRSPRPYKVGWTHEDTVKEMRAQKGTHFDPAVFDAFLELEKVFATIYRELAD